MKSVQRQECRARRHRRIRRKVSGTAERPRLCVMISNQHAHVQFVDDDRGVTLAAMTTAGKAVTGWKNNVQGAKQFGQKVAEVAKSHGIQAVVFDRGGHAYHGRVKAIADAAREAGLAL